MWALMPKQSSGAMPYFSSRDTGMESLHSNNTFRGLFQLVYGVEWYPSFLILQAEERYEMIGEIPVETLIQELDRLAGSF